MNHSRSAIFLTVLGLALTSLPGCAVPAGSATASSASAHIGDASVTSRVLALLPADVLLLGEQHDAAEHHRIEQLAVEELAARGQLAALALEMAEQGHSTAGLPRDASEDAVQATLGWQEAGWPWPPYRPAVMAAVRAGVPVVGANLPRAQMRSAMADARLDAVLHPMALAEQRDAIRDGHCQLLPNSQIAPMTRIQLARDAAMARTVERQFVPGQTVLLIAGGGHVRRDLGVPQHLPPQLRAKVVLAQTGAADDASKKEANQRFAEAAGVDLLLATAALPPSDPCAALRAPPPGSSN